MSDRAEAAAIALLLFVGAGLLGLSLGCPWAFPAMGRAALQITERGLAVLGSLAFALAAGFHWDLSVRRLYPGIDRTRHDEMASRSGTAGARR
jgi:hypothetical protein